MKWLNNLLLKHELSKSKLEIKQLNNNITELIPGLYIHPDIINLLWIGDGEKKNYTKNSNNIIHEINNNGIRIEISFNNTDEPSLLLLSLPIEQCNETESPPYYPCYSNLTPQQRWMYWKFLKNPYDSHNNIGYVFLFYYGLERHLMSDNFKKAFEVILKLRDIYNNASFQSYTSQALIITCIQRKSPELALKFINSIDKDYKRAIDFNLLLLLKYSLYIPLTAIDIIENYKGIGYKKDRYIKNYNTLFIETMNELILSKYETTEIMLNQLINDKTFKQLPKGKYSVFANISIKNNSISLPSFYDSPLMSMFYELLDMTHETIKNKLSKLRKKGTPLAADPPKKQKLKENEVII